MLWQEKLIQVSKNASSTRLVFLQLYAYIAISTLGFLDGKFLMTTAGCEKDQSKLGMTGVQGLDRPWVRFRVGDCKW